MIAFTKPSTPEPLPCECSWPYECSCGQPNIVGLEVSIADCNTVHPCGEMLLANLAMNVACQFLPMLSGPKKITITIHSPSQPPAD